MKLSTKGQYGTRAMLELALNYERGPLLLREIAQKQGIPNRYLEHLILHLKVAGLVKSIRGAHGGYALTKSPSEIKLNEVLQALEGPVGLVECLDDPKSCSRVKSCVTRDIWERMKEAIVGVLESTTLEDLVEQQKQRQSL